MDETPPVDTGRGRRRLKNFLLAPEKQIRLGFLGFAFALVCVSAIFASVLFRFNQIIDALVLLARDPPLAFDAAANAKRILWETYGVLVASFLAFTVALVVRISHRYLGPMVPIDRQIKALREGRYDARVRLREGDEFRETAEQLNALAEDLQRRLGDQRGFSLLEMLVGMSIALAMILAVASLQTSITSENRALSQKLEFAEFNRAMSQVLADDNVCTCNTKGLALQPDASGGTFHATFTAPLYPGFSAGGCSPVGSPMASIGQPLPGTRYQMPVASIQVMGLTPQPTDPISQAAGLSVYTGYVGVTVGDPPGASDRKVARPLAPAQVGKKFFVSGGTIAACGQAASEISYAYADDWQTNGPTADPATGLSTAKCPAGMLAIGGGWIAQPGGTPSTCGFSYAAALASQPDGSYQTWSVLLLCETYKAFAACYRPSFQTN